jgi:hypothetical protein
MGYDNQSVLGRVCVERRGTPGKLAAPPGPHAEGEGEQASWADSQVLAHSARVKRKLFLFFKSFYNLQTTLNSIQIRILMTSTHKIKYKNTSPFKEKYASA